MNKKTLRQLVTGLGAALVIAPLAASAGETVTYVDVDYSGKPPFKRVVKTFERGEAVDFAQFEEDASVRYGRPGDARPGKAGKPPFHDVRPDSDEVAEFARFEQLPGDERSMKGTRPPFNRH